MALIQGIYDDRHFQVRDGMEYSKRHKQCAGISQGCPLSPFIFVMVMSVLVHDAVGLLGPKDKESFDRGDLATLLYADDTLVVGISVKSVKNFLEAIASTGQKYGMELHWNKFQKMQLRCDYDIHTPEGQLIENKETMLYLGASVWSDGSLSSELGKKLGVAWSDFNKLAQLWKHTSVTIKRKVEVFNACISSKLMYGLASAWLNASERKRLDGFQARCLRKILGIKPAYFSRVSNKIVIQKSDQKLFTTQLLKQQLLLYGRVARAPDTDLLRQLTFCPGSLRPATDRYVRKIGRPRNEWAPMLEKEVAKMLPNIVDRMNCMKNPIEWKHCVYRSF